MRSKSSQEIKNKGVRGGRKCGGGGRDSWEQDLIRNKIGWRVEQTGRNGGKKSSVRTKKGEKGHKWWWRGEVGIVDEIMSLR